MEHWRARAPSCLLFTLLQVNKGLIVNFSLTHCPNLPPQLLIAPQLIEQGGGKRTDNGRIEVLEEFRGADSRAHMMGMAFVRGTWSITSMKYFLESVTHSSHLLPTVKVPHPIHT